MMFAKLMYSPCATASSRVMRMVGCTCSSMARRYRTREGEIPWPRTAGLLAEPAEVTVRDYGKISFRSCSHWGGSDVRGRHASAKLGTMPRGSDHTDLGSRLWARRHARRLRPSRDVAHRRKTHVQCPGFTATGGVERGQIDPHHDRRHDRQVEGFSESDRVDARVDRLGG